MSIKVVLLNILLLSIIYIRCATPSPQGNVQVPHDCAQACPHNHGQKLCARNTVTGKLGTFESDCILGRYNSCIRTVERYEFVKYGNC